MKKPNVMKIFNTVKKAVEKKSPEILIAFGIAGMITTTVLAVKATPKAMEKIKEVEKNKKEEFDRDHGYSELDTMFKLTKPEVVKATWKCYIPAAISGATSIACIVGANTVHSKRNAAIATAYKLSEKALTEYKEATIEEVGKEKAKAIKDRVAQKQLDNNPVNDSQVIITGTQNVKGEIKKMIKVIKPRSRRNIECMNCGALLSYEKEDVKKAASKKI